MRDAGGAGVENRLDGRDESSRLLAMACSKCSLAVYRGSGEVKNNERTREGRGMTAARGHVGDGEV